MGCNPAKAQSSMYDSFVFTVKKMNFDSFDKVKLYLILEPSTNRKHFNRC
jgi:hypothetical protein